MASQEGLSHTPQLRKAGLEVSAGRGWGKGGRGRRAGEQFPSVRLAGNVFDLRAVAAREGGAPEKGRGSPVCAWSGAGAFSGLPDSWHFLLQLVR